MEVLIGIAIFAGYGVFAIASILWGAESRPGFNGKFDDGRPNLPLSRRPPR